MANRKLGLRLWEWIQTPYPCSSGSVWSWTCLISPSHGILSSSNSTLRLHRDPFTSCRAPRCSSSPVFHIVVLSPLSHLHPPLLCSSNYLLFIRSQLKCHFLQEDSPSTQVSITCSSGTDITPCAPSLVAPYHYHIHLFTLWFTPCPHPVAYDPGIPYFCRLKH